jgi:hypothetical protein
MPTPSDRVPPATTVTARPVVPAEYDDDGDNAPDQPPAPAARDVVTARARALDPSVAEVLREEAARESRKRAADFSSLESQPELGLDSTAPEDEADRRTRVSRERLSRMRGVPATTTVRDVPPRKQDSLTTASASESVASAPTSTPISAPTAAASNSRRDLLPDVEEINRTLRSSRERRKVETVHGRAERDEHSSGFWRGFIGVLLIAVSMAALYVLAPQIADRMPQTEQLLSAYVAWVDQLRLWLDAQVTALLLGLDGLSSEATVPEGG